MSGAGLGLLPAVAPCLHSANHSSPLPGCSHPPWTKGTQPQLRQNLATSLTEHTRGHRHSGSKPNLQKQSHPEEGPVCQSGSAQPARAPRTHHPQLAAGPSSFLGDRLPFPRDLGPHPCRGGPAGGQRPDGPPGFRPGVPKIAAAQHPPGTPCRPHDPPRATTETSGRAGPACATRAYKHRELHKSTPPAPEPKVRAAPLP
jgi:hypothetical protein